ncbi:uncharacterized protein LOC134711028 [Mytilus trossulus]|uniref:uncharacterized protein LOC134711028 n=1 Tax=Mytilus trossulus TaxID=6551 RepID=UPI0030056EA3
MAKISDTSNERITTVISSNTYGNDSLLELEHVELDHGFVYKATKDCDITIDTEILGRTMFAAIRTCDKQLLRLAFLRKDFFKGTLPYTWNSPNGRDKNQIDHLMINGRWKNSLCDVRALRGADCGSDHHLICGKIRLKLRKAVKNRTNKREIFDTVKLKQPEILKKFKIELRNRFQVLENLQDNKPSTVESLEQGLSRIETVFKETSRNTLGLRQLERKKWISDDTWTSIQQRKDIKTKLNSTKSERIQTTLRKEYSVKDKEVKRKTKADKAIYLETLAKEAETAASKGELSTVYKDGKTLASKSQQLERWTEQFKETLNAEHQADVPVIEQFGMELDIDIGEVSREEIRKAILRLKNGKSPSLDAITA